jgi:protein O-GlcNAc transferase
MTIPQALQIAVQHHQAGRLADAEALCRQILAAQPNHAGALHLLGLVAHQAGRDDLAAEWIRQAVALDPNNPYAHSNLGEALRALGRLDEAIAAFRCALQLRPNFPEVCNNLGNALRDRGQLDEAIAACRRALALHPGYPQAHNNLGNALGDQGRHDEAIAAYRRALELQPDYPEAHTNLGVTLAEQRRTGEAIAAHRRALELRPDYLEAHTNLGSALKDRGYLDEAVAAYRRALQLKPDFPEALNNLGVALKGRGQMDEAIAAYRYALQAKPGYVSAHDNLIHALHLHSNLDSGSIAKEHQRWNHQFSDPLKPFLQPHANDRNPVRPLRIGYVSPDFLNHVVGRYALPLVERHDREKFEILCYSGVARPDWMTERFRASARAWRNTLGVSDARFSEMIREDAVDILVDLTMHTAGNRLTTFARQPAPVQVTWLAYPGSTGLQSIGYRLTDACMDPPGEKPPWSSEEPVRLPGCWCCYEPPSECPPINALPALSAKGLTLGSLNNFAKVNERVLALWARVLVALERSRLLILCPEGRTRERVRAFFGARGIVAERVEFARFQEPREYLKLYQRIDLGLDPFPCNGMTTTCDALWMGVPVLTLPGEMPVSRAGLSLLSCVGLGEFAVPSQDNYVRIAVELAENLPRLANLRATLRPRMKSSPLMDAPRFARNVEAAYRRMWQDWITGQSPIRK